MIAVVGHQIEAVTVAPTRIPAQLRRQVEGLYLEARERCFATQLIKSRGERKATLRHRSYTELETKTLGEYTFDSKAVVTESRAGEVCLDDGLTIE